VNPSTRMPTVLFYCHLCIPVSRTRDRIEFSLRCDVHLRLSPLTFACQPGPKAAPCLHGILRKPLCCSFGVPSCAAITTCACHAKTYNIRGLQLPLYAYFDAIYATTETPDAKAHTYITQCFTKNDANLNICRTVRLTLNLHSA
jgi:hypothetical protein